MACGNFTDKVIEHFKSPRNVGIIDDANGIGSFGEPDCGDSLTIYIKVKDDIIEDISFLAFGCVAAIATSSITTELVKGKTLEDALKLTDKDIAKALDGLPENKMHCSVLGASALKNAIEDYYKKANI